MIDFIARHVRFAHVVTLKTVITRVGIICSLRCSCGEVVVEARGVEA